MNGSAPAGRRGVALVVAALVVALAGCTVVTPAPEAPRPRPTEPFPPPRPDAPPAGERPAPREVGAVPREFREIRGLWVVRTSLTDPESVRTMVDRAHRAGFNTLIVQVRGRGDAFYDAVLEPRADALRGQPETFDPLALVLEEAHARGMAVHAWLNTHLVASGGLPAAPHHVVRTRPDLLAVPRELAGDLYRANPYDPSYVRRLFEHAAANSDRVEGVYTNPSHPDVHDRIYDVWMEIASRYPVDGMHFDYVRYPGPDYDYSRASLEAFRRWVDPRLQPAERLRLESSAAGNPLAWTEARPELWDAFRREQISRLVRRVYRGVKALRPDVVVSAAVFSDPVDAYGARYQDWAGWLEEGIVDVVAPMAYTADDGIFRERVGRAVEVAGDPRRVWAGIGSYLTGYDGTLRKIGLAREVGAGGLVLFSYDWIVGEGVGPRGGPFLLGVGVEAFGQGR